MKAVVMAGGEGTRLRPITSGRPKPMAELFGKPVLEHTVELLKENGITDICFTLRYLPGTIEEWFGDGAAMGVRIESHVETEPLGTAGSVRACMDFIGDEDVLIISGDSVCDFDLRKCIAVHKDRGADATLVLYEHPEPLEYGLVVTDDEGRIIRFVEKPGWEMVVTDAVNTGIYVLSPKTVASIPVGQYDFGKDLFPRMLAEGQGLYGVRAEGYWCDIGSPEAYRKCCMDILSGKTGILRAAHETVKGVFSESRLPAGAELVPPVWIGRRCAVEKGARIGPNVVLSDGSCVCAEAIVTESVINGASICRKATVSGAIVGRGAVIREAAEIEDGAVLGDGVDLGRGTLITSGVKIWPNAKISAGIKVSRDITSGHKRARLPFSTDSSISGAYPEVLSPEKTMLFGNAMAVFGRIGVGYCGGEKARVLASSFSSGVCGAGGDVVELDADFLSEAAFACELYGLSGGVFVRQNGAEAVMTFFGRDGKPLDRAGQRRIEGFGATCPSGANAGSLVRASGISCAYAAAAVREIGKMPAGSRVAVLGTGAENRVLRGILESAGCEALSRKRTGTACLCVTDGGSGLEGLDEEGRVLGTERMLAITALCAMEDGVVRVAATYDATAALESLAEARGCRILRVGRDGGAAEELYAEQRFMHDGVFAACHIAAHMARRGITLSALNQKVPDFASVQRSVAAKAGGARAMRELRATCSEFAEDMLYGLSTATEKGRVLITPCANGRELLIRSEGVTEELAEELCTEFEKRISGMNQACTGAEKHLLQQRS